MDTSLVLRMGRIFVRRYCLTLWMMWSQMNLKCLRPKGFLRNYLLMGLLREPEMSLKKLSNNTLKMVHLSLS